MKRIRLAGTLASLVIGALVLSACPPKRQLEIEDQATDEQQVNEEALQEDEAAAGEGSVEITQDWTEIPNLGVVTFPYDAASFGAGQREILRQNVAIIKKLPDSVTVRVEGHTDERGTIEYNIALGQRRANAVRDYYRNAGVSASRIQTISYGEERPVCSVDSESCHERNRRAVTTVRSPQGIRVNIGEDQ